MEKLTTLCKTWDFLFLLGIFLFSTIFSNQTIEKQSQMAEVLSKMTKNQWTIEEQAFIKLMHEDQKVQSWKMISQALNKSFKQSCRGFTRNSKQCRDRYVNYIKFNGCSCQTATWSEQQVKILYEKYIEYGPRWTAIAKQLPNRSENSIKNKFYNCLRKFSRKLNSIIRQNRSINTKPLKYELIIKALEYCKIYDAYHCLGQSNLRTSFNDYGELRLRIIKSLQSFEESQEIESSIFQLLLDIVQFRKQTKFVTLPKIHGAKSQAKSRTKLCNIKKDEELSSSTSKKGNADLELDQSSGLAQSEQKNLTTIQSVDKQVLESVINQELKMINEDNFNQYRGSQQIWNFENDIALSEFRGQHFLFNWA